MVSGQNLGKITPNVVKIVKKQALSLSFFFHILHGEYLLKQKVVVVQTFEWKFKTNIARNDSAKFLVFRAKFLLDLGQNW